MVKRLARYLQYMDRSKRYISILQFILIALIAFDKQVDFFDWMFYGLAVAIILGMLVIGFIDKKIGIYEAEQDYVTSNNPQIQEIKQMLNDLKEDSRKDS